MKKDDKNFSEKMGKNKKQAGNSNKESSATNTPLGTLIKFIGLNNLVPYDADLDFDVPPLWGAEVTPNLKQYPKLFNYLSVEANQGYFWQVAFYEIKKIREFIKTFVEIAEQYQEACKRATEFERLARVGFGKPLPEEILSDPRNINFHITNKPYSNSLLGEPLFPKGAREIEINALAARLFSFVVDSFSLTVDKNHLADISISQSEFLDAIKGVDLRRLKKCLICSNVIWAHRLNTMFCSKECSNEYYQQLYQSDPEKRKKYNKQRKEVYQSKKEQKEAERFLSEEKQNSRREWQNQDFSKKEK